MTPSQEALLSAVRRGDLAASRSLLAEGVDPNALELDRAKGHGEVVARLEQA